MKALTISIEAKYIKQTVALLAIKCPIYIFIIILLLVGNIPTTDAPDSLSVGQIEIDACTTLKGSVKIQANMNGLNNFFDLKFILRC